MGGLFGGGGEAESKNKAYDFIKGTYAPQAGGGVDAFGMYGNLLGLGGPGAGSQALQGFWDGTGGQFLLNQGLDSVNNKYHSLGLGRSGANMKAMEQYRSGLASTKLGEMMNHLGQVSQLGLGAGGLITNAGQVSKGGSQGGGLGSILGSALGTIAMSDRRTKTNVERIGDWDDRGDGLGRYRFAYKWAPDIMLEGVMADEVERLRPAALGPVMRGFQSVNYAMLGASA